MNKAEKEKILRLCELLPQMSALRLVNTLTVMVLAINDYKAETTAK